VRPLARIGEGTTLGSHIFIDDDVHIGPNCIVESGACINAGVTIGQRVRIGSGATFAPRIGASPATHVDDDAWIGANSTIYAGVEIGSGAVIRAGSVVARSVPPASIVEGNPAIIIGYANAEWGSAGAMRSPDLLAEGRVELLPTKGVSLYHMPVITDLRGNLTVAEFETSIPFRPLRCFMVFDVPSKEIRGEHAHRECHQFLVCVRGSCAVVADDGHRRVEVALDAPHTGLHIPPMTWGVQYKYSADALLLVFASHHYDSADYIRDYAQFKSMTCAK
jgi:carbonic anhydrase/acetyltransferase-like protein (isoleucine patch superfamily)